MRLDAQGRYDEAIQALSAAYGLRPPCARSTSPRATAVEWLSHSELAAYVPSELALEPGTPGPVPAGPMRSP